MNKRYEQIVKTLVRARKLQNMTQRQVGKMINVLPATISHFENMVREQRLDFLEDYANAVGYDLEIAVVRQRIEL